MILKKIKDWILKNIAFLLGGLAIFIMIACFVSGYNYHKNHFPCPEPKTDTVKVVDKSWHRVVDSLTHIVDSLKNRKLPDPVIVQLPGVPFEVPADVDTAAILKRYYTSYRYTWYYPDSAKWTDKDEIHVRLKTTVTQNKPYVYDFSYQWLKPQTIINNSVDNSVSYNKYLYIGLDLPFYNKIENAEITALLAFRRGYIGAGYSPLSKGFSLKTGVKLFTWE